MTTRTGRAYTVRKKAAVTGSTSDNAKKIAEKEIITAAANARTKILRWLGRESPFEAEFISEAYRAVSPIAT